MTGAVDNQINGHENNDTARPKEVVLELISYASDENGSNSSSSGNLLPSQDTGSSSCEDNTNVFEDIQKEDLSKSDMEINTVTTKTSACVDTLHFIVSCIGYSIGLGNVWRFPYLCYIHKGGTFLIAYGVMAIFVGLPLFYLEVGLGQYSGQSPLNLFNNMCPLFGGIGSAMLVVTTLIMITYNVVVAWTLFYTFASFTKRLPWEDCQESWTSENCYSPSDALECKKENLTYWKAKCHSASKICSESNLSFSGVDPYCVRNDGVSKILVDVRDLSFNRVSVAEEYFSKSVLDSSSGIDHFGVVKWQIGLCLLLAWLLVFVCLIRSTYTSGKLTYFTALFPYVIMLVLFGRSISLDGAVDGLLHFVTPHWELLRNPWIWSDAAVQVIFSLGPAFGVLISLSSYNRFNNNCLRDSLFVVGCDTITSLLAGLTLFSAIGYMSKDSQVPIEYVLKSGENLAFVGYSVVIGTLEFAPVWSFLFFVMLLTLGLDSQYIGVESIRTTLEDVWPHLKGVRIQVLAVICCCGWLLGLPMSSQAGIYIFQLLQTCCMNWSLFVIAICECLVVMWIYPLEGHTDIRNHLEDMMQSKVSWFWTVCWRYITPLVACILLVIQWLFHRPLRYGAYVFPSWANDIGLLISILPISAIVIFAVVQCTTSWRKGQSLSLLLRPTDDWGPNNLQVEDEQSISSKSFQLPISHKLGYARSTSINSKT